MLLFAAYYPPAGWAYCEGQLLDISNFPNLYKKTGDQFGGDGKTKFALPDLREAEKEYGGARFIISLSGEMTDVDYLSMILPSTDPVAPENWAFCDGQLMAISKEVGLFSLMGTTYGGNGTVTFALPDLRAISKKDGVRYMICTKGLYPSRG